MNLASRLLTAVRMPQRRQDPRVTIQPRAMMVDGQMRTIAQLRSTWNSSQWVSMITGEGGSVFDPVTLATAYSSGLTAFVCINARAGLASEVPIQVIDDAENEIKDSPASAFVDCAPQMIWRAVASKLIWGAVYFLKRYNSYGYPTGLEWLSPLDVRIDLDYARNEVRGYFIRRGTREEYYKPHCVVADYTFNPFSDVNGISALEVAMTRSNIEANIGKFGEAFFGNSARPDGMLTYDGPLSPEDAKKARTYWEGIFKGAINAFRTAVMGNEAGGKWVWQAVNANPVDLAMPELSNLADMKICAVMQVSPVLVGLGSASDPLSAQSTYEAIRRRALQDIAIPDVRQLCGALNDQWLHKDFDRSSVRWTLEPDISAITSDALGTPERITTANTAVAGHVWSVNEAREYTGKEPERVIAIQRNPDWPTQVWLAGGMFFNEYRSAVGLAPSENVNGLIWDLDPMRKPQPPAPSQFTFSMPQPQQALAPVPQLAAPQSPIAETITVEPVPARRNPEKLAQLHELDLWRKRVRKSGAAVRFSVEILPGEIELFVRRGLDSGREPQSVFVAAREAVKTGVLADWEEGEHPRDPDGKFGDGVGGNVKVPDGGKDKKPGGNSTKDKSKAHFDKNTNINAADKNDKNGKMMAAQIHKISGGKAPEDFISASGADELDIEKYPKVKAKLSYDAKERTVTAEIYDPSNMEKSPQIKRIFHFDENGKPLHITNDHFYLPKEETGTGLGTKMFSSQVDQASAMGFKSIQTTAGKSQYMNGYYTWPRLGYDAEASYYSKQLPDAIFAKIPKTTIPVPSSSMGDAVNFKVSDLMKTKEGRDWWKANGKQMDMEFNLSPRSRSRKVLNAYKKERFGGK